MSELKRRDIPLHTFLWKREDCEGFFEWMMNKPILMKAK
jgi:hypothetical protein